MKRLALFLSCLAFLAGSTALADDLDERFRPLIEIAYELRLFEAALKGDKLVDAKGVEVTIKNLNAALRVLERDRNEIIPLIASTHGANKIVVSRLEEVSKRMGRVARGINSQPLVAKTQDLRAEIKALLTEAHKYSKQHPDVKPERRLSERATTAVEGLKALAEDPQLLPLLDHSLAREKLLKPKVILALLPIVPLTATPKLNDLFDVVDAFEKYVLTYKKDARIVEHTRILVYNLIAERLFRDDEQRIFAGPVIGPDGAQLLLQKFRSEGRIPNSVDVSIVRDATLLGEAVADKMKLPGRKRSFFIVYNVNHAGLVYIDDIAGPTRALIIDSTGAFVYAGLVANKIQEVLKQFHTPIFMVATPRQVDDMNCLSFVMEDIVSITNEPDIFAKLEVQEPQTDSFNLIECRDPQLALATQKLSALPADATKNCVVRRRAFTREERSNFIKRNTHIRLVHDQELAGRVDKAQYLAMEKRAAANRVKVLELYLGRHNL